jgi:hypothetical protein
VSQTPGWLAQRPVSLTAWLMPAPGGRTWQNVGSVLYNHIHCCCCLWMSLHPGCVQFGGHRIAGLSGTYVSQHYHWGHHEKLPYDERAIKSIYHVRQLEVHRLMQVCCQQGEGGFEFAVPYIEANCAATQCSRQRLPTMQEGPLGMQLMS